jgi:Protein of unknown function (DUF2568)
VSAVSDEHYPSRARVAVTVSLRALLETGIVAGLAWWGFHAGGAGARGALLALASTAVGFGLWGLVDFRFAGAWAEPLRLVWELAISAAAAAALIAAGRPALGWSLAVLSAAYHALVYALGGRLLQSNHGPATERAVSVAGPVVGVERLGGVVTITCAGEISDGSRPALEAALEDALASVPEAVRFDLRSTWLDSHGIALVLGLYDRCVRSGVRVEAMTAPAARRVFSRLGLPPSYRLEGGEIVRIVRPPR